MAAEVGVGHLCYHALKLPRYNLAGVWDKETQFKVEGIHHWGVSEQCSSFARPFHALGIEGVGPAALCLLAGPEVSVPSTCDFVSSWSVRGTHQDMPLLP